MSPYQTRIKEDLARSGYVGVNSRHIEGWMRLERGTLDSLAPATWRHELKMAIECVKAATPEQNEQLAKSYGL